MTENKMRVVIMGCSGSGGMPYTGNVWGKCDPNNPKNRRTRPSVFLEKDGTRIVIDTGPEFRQQINATGITGTIDAVLYTHTHFDHVMGLDDLRSLFIRGGKKPIPVYGSKETLEELTRRFDYAFEMTHREYPAIVEANLLPSELMIGGMKIQSFEQIHGDIRTNGFRIGDFAYSTDVNELPNDALAVLKGVKIWVVGMYFNPETPQGTFNHAGIDKIKEWADIIQPEMMYLTHLTASADYQTMCDYFPPHIRPAYDGLEFLL